MGLILLSILPLPLVLRCCDPKTATWLAILTSVCSAGLAACFFCLWQWLQYPVLAYLDAIVYGLWSLAAALGVVAKCLRQRGELLSPPETGRESQQQSE
jgi:hypothetical protein